MGALLKDMGQKVPTTHLIDPHQSMRQLALAMRVLPKALPRMDKKRSRRLGASFQNPLLPAQTGH